MKTGQSECASLMLFLGQNERGKQKCVSVNLPFQNSNSKLKRRIFPALLFFFERTRVYSTSN